MPYLRQVRSWLVRRAPALVHVNTIVALPEAAVARTTRLPVLLHVHEMLRADVLSRGAAILTRLVADRVVTVSEASTAALRARGVAATIVPNGADLSRAAAVPPSRGATGSPVVIGLLGTIASRKGTDVFVEAAERLMAERDDVVFRLVGPLPVGPERPWAEALVAAAAERGIEHRVVQDAAAELRDWDVFVLPSRADPFPLAVLEAMAGALPVIGSAVDGISEQLADGAGILVPAGDPRILTDAMRTSRTTPRGVGPWASQRSAGLGRASRSTARRS